MESFDGIHTENWLNIPGCVSQAVNAIIEHLKVRDLEQAGIKAALNDLSGKFVEKTARDDASITEISSSLQSFSVWTASEIGVLKTKQEASSQGYGNKIRSLTDIVQENNTKNSALYGEFRKVTKETKEISSRLEVFKNKTEIDMQENIENIKTLIDSCNNSLTKKILTIATEFKEKTEKNTGILEGVNEYVEENKKIVKIHQEQLKINHQHIERISRDCFNYKGELEKFDVKQLNLSNQVDSLIIATTIIPSVQDTPSETNENKQEAIFFNPVIEKLSEIEENLHKLEANYKKAVKYLEDNHTQDLINFKQLIEHWTNDQIFNALNDKFSKISSKLEWLPDRSDDIKKMSATEARLFLIESRIRGEEKARIISDQKLRSDITEIKEVSTTKSLINKPIAFSPKETKVINIEFNSNKLRRVRPNSSIYRREGNPKDRLFEKFSLKANDHSTASYNFPF